MRIILTILSLFSMVMIARADAPALGKPQRIISISLATDEILWEILTEAHSTERFIACSPSARLPDQSGLGSVLPSSVVPFKKSLDFMASLRPDLIIAAPYADPAFLASLSRLHYNVMIVGEFFDLGGLTSTILAVGRVIGEDAAAAIVAQRFKKQTQPRPMPRRPATALLYAGAQQVWGDASLPSAAWAAAGGINVATTAGLQGWPSVDPEWIARTSVDFVVVAGAPEKKAFWVEQLKKQNGWAQQPAVRGGRIIMVPERLFFAASVAIAETVAWMHVAILANEAGT